MNQGLLPGYNDLGSIVHALGRAYNATFHDPYISMMGNESALGNIPHQGGWYDASAQNRIDLTGLSPLRQAILRSVLQGSQINADMHPSNSPILQMALLRALNPQNARLG